MNKIVRQANDDSLEWAILAARTWSLIAALGVVLLACWFAWSGELRALWTLFALGVTGAPASWFGWWLHGNDTWRSGQVERRGECGATYQDMTCDRLPEYHQVHWDQAKDPDGKRRWT